MLMLCCDCCCMVLKLVLDSEVMFCNRVHCAYPMSPPHNALSQLMMQQAKMLNALIYNIKEETQHMSAEATDVQSHRLSLGYILVLNLAIYYC